MEQIYRLEQIHKHFGDNHVLRGIDLDIRRGENLVILGGSGSGKSVMLKLLVGLLTADKGKIYFDGNDITQLPEKGYYPIRTRVSYLFQGGALFDSMNVYQNLAYPLKAHTDMSSQDILAQVKDALKKVGLEEIEHLFPGSLSGGMMKRVALARAIINQPELILYDEPTTGLDPLTTHTINELIRKMQKDLQISSVIVTHDMPTVYRCADRLAFLDEGCMVFIGTIEQARQSTHPKLRAYFQGDDRV